MIKKQVSLIDLLMVSILILGACGKFQAKADIIQTIESALEKNARIENGRFESVLSIKGESEQLNQESEGTFIRKSDTEYDWYSKTRFKEGGGLTSQELADINGNQFQRIIIDQQTASDWLPVSEPTTSFEGIAGTLFGHGLIESEMAEWQVHEKVDTIQYEITLSEAYSDRMKKESRKEVQKSIDDSKKNNVEDAMIQAMEMQLKISEETDYLDHVITYEINTDGYMRAVNFKTTVSPLNEEEYTIVNDLMLTEYNSENTEGLLPEIGK